MDPVSKFTDRDYLRKEQYRDGSNLRSRASLHGRFKTNPEPWFAWVFSHFDIPPSAAILDVGCGPGSLWSEERDQIHPTWGLFLSDLSPGMVTEARQSLRSQQNISYLSFDAQYIPLPAAAFDAVIANHMLYHVPDVGRALAAIQRILKPGGVLYAVTNGRSHMQELDHFVSQASPDLPPESTGVFKRSTANFSLQTGREALARYFDHVELQTYPDALHVTDAEAIVQYIQSSSVFGLSEADLDRLRALLQEKIQQKGAINISKETGIFIAHKAGNYSPSIPYRMQNLL